MRFAYILKVESPPIRPRELEHILSYIIDVLVGHHESGSRHSLQFGEASDVKSQRLTGGATEIICRTGNCGAARAAT